MPSWIEPTTRGQDGVEYATSQPALGEHLHTPYHRRKAGPEGFITLLGNVSVNRILAMWRLEARVRFHGGESVYTEYHPTLQRAQQSARQLALNADRIEQEWDQVQPGRLPQ
ncbi:hypothetical protein HUN08_12370 [Gordonia sp. X0973]|uniref:hypothetical protein n=1 Tax=Gordonia sp. X0973 TaxID=2742602 RepID=UPI000F52E813|nr:hypothetical protein [Gordonia sp. X0973]QKT07890.1 hypothetical protein HUN08_12370 [Gordonia sp. X0973]